MTFWHLLLFSSSLNSMAPPARKKIKKREKNSRRPLPHRKKSKNRGKKQKRILGLQENHLQPLLPYIPEHVIFSKILPFLSFNNLPKLKPVCKSWCHFISSNPILPLDRFPRRRYHHDVSSSPSSSNYYSGVIFPECNSNGQLVFLPTSSRGDAGPLEEFVSVSFSEQPCKELIGSADGLLCLTCSGDDNIVYVCNPLTKEGHVIPLSSNSWHDDRVYVWRSSIGLAYDLSKSPAQYKLVCPWSHYFNKEERLVFGFEVFSSQTNRWEKSYNNYYAEDEPVGCDCLDNIFTRRRDDFPAMKSTYAGGVLYWDCCFFLMYFHPDKGYGGIVSFPFDPFEDNEDHRIGEFKGHVTCSRASRGRGMELWIMDANRSTEWELMHQVSLRNRKKMKIMFEEYYGVIPLPYGGDNGGRLFMRVPFKKEVQDNVLCYDLNSGKLNKFCTLLTANRHYKVFNRHNFLYRSSMVSLPKLGKP